MKNRFALFLIVALIMGFGIFIFMGSGGAKIAGNLIDSKGEVQIIKLSVQGSNYVMNPSEVKKGIPVRIEADMSKMPGCSKSIVISSFNIRKTVTSADNTIEFTPDKAGTFNIACSMNMYRGTFTVLESDGSKSAYVDTSAPSGGSCGASGGGCGCGG
ncbi:MAG: cupredoxin domain-containing protein [Nanoarchaeota archaeon]